MRKRIVLWVLLGCGCLPAACASGGRSQPAAAPVSTVAAAPSIQSLYEAGDDRQVTANVGAAASVTPSDLWFAAHSHLRLGQQENAVQILMRLRQTGDPAMQAAADLLLASLGGDAATLERARTAAAAYPNHPFVQYELGVAYVSQNDFAAAARAFDASVEADPSLSYAYYQAALAYERLNRNDLVVIRLDMFVRLAPNAPERRQAEAILRTARGN